MIKWALPGDDTVITLEIGAVTDGEKATSPVAENRKEASPDSEVEKLNLPGYICDVDLTIKLLRECGSFAEILEKAKIKSDKKF